MNDRAFGASFNHIANMHGGVAQLRKLILDLAVQGRLSSPVSSDEIAQELLVRSAIRKRQLISQVAVPQSRKLPAGSSIGKPLKLPQTWEWSRIEEIAAYVQRGKGPTYAQTSSVPVVSQKCVQWSGFDGTKCRFVSEASLENYGSERLLVVGDLLWNSTGTGTVGRVVVYPGMPGFDRVVADSHVTVIRMTDYLPDFLRIWLSSSYIQNVIDRLTTGTTKQQELSTATVRRLAVPVPSIDEQKRLVGRVDELMALCNGLEAQQAVRAEARKALTSSTLNRISNVDSAPELRKVLAAFASAIDLHLAPGDGDLAALRELRRTIIDLASCGRLTHQNLREEPAVDLLKRIAAERDRMVEAKEIRERRGQAGVEAGAQKFEAPAGWEWCRLGQLVLANEAGWSPVCPPYQRTDESEWGVLKLSAVSWGRFQADEHKVLATGLLPRPAIEVRDGDFLMSRANTAALVGRSVVVSDPPPRLMLSDLTVRLRFWDRVTAEYVNLLNGGSFIRAHYATVSKGTNDTMKKLSRDQILATPVPLPPLAEQSRIIQVVELLFAHCDELEQQLLAARSKLRDLGASVAAQVVGESSSGPEFESVLDK